MPAAFIGFATPVCAVDDVATAQTVIRSQEQALGRDDAEVAYALAAPAIRSVFPDAQTFLSMVRAGYAPVYRHRSFEFGASRSVGGIVVQEVQIVDADGVAWAARYTLEAQPDGSLKISGCTLLKLTEA
ncbi:MAG: DUF4864 domain-containing protein [Pseudolabrys sp.]